MQHFIINLLYINIEDNSTVSAFNIAINRFFFLVCCPQSSERNIFMRINDSFVAYLNDLGTH